MDIKIEYLIFYDLGSELSYEEIEGALEKIPGENVEEYSLDEEKETPDYIRYPEPVLFNPRPDFTRGDETYPVTGKIFKSGTLSLRVTVTLPDTSLDELNEFLAENRSLSEEIRHHCNEIHRQLKPHFPVDISRQEFYHSGQSEVYPVFCLSSTDFEDTARMVDQNSEEITALLNRRYRQRNFSGEQKEITLNNRVRFYNNDCSIIHWNGSLLIDNQGQFSSVLFILELVNIQFLNLMVYDDYVDNFLSDYMGRIDRFLKVRLLLHVPGLRNRISEITRLRVEIDRITEMLDNYEKYFGEWYLARIYTRACDAFEMERWRELLQSRLEKVTELYSMLEEEVNRSRMLFLNVLTLMLFILWFVIG